jgi:hypothetical protein
MLPLMKQSGKYHSERNRYNDDDYHGAIRCSQSLWYT